MRQSLATTMRHLSTCYNLPIMTATTATLTIRPYLPSDTEAVRKLHVKALKAVVPFEENNPWDKDLDRIDEIYGRNHGIFLIGWADGTLVAMGALRRVTATICELKRLRVDPDHQRQGYGRQMLTTLEHEAKRLGYTTIQLETTAQLTAAQKLYEQSDYTEVKRQTEGLPFETIFYTKSN